MREHLSGVVVRLGVFLTICLLTALLLVAVFGQARFDSGKTYFAEFTNVSNLREGKLVRIAGVEVGKVKKISINQNNLAVVEFSADPTVVLTQGTKAATADTATAGRTGTELSLNAGVWEDATSTVMQPAPAGPASLAA